MFVLVLVILIVLVLVIMFPPWGKKSGLEGGNQVSGGGGRTQSYLDSVVMYTTFNKFN